MTGEELRIRDINPHRLVAHQRRIRLPRAIRLTSPAKRSLAAAKGPPHEAASSAPNTMGIPLSAVPVGTGRASLIPACFNKAVSTKKL